MKEKPANSAHQKVIENYFQTTSAIGSSQDSETVSKSLLGLRRQLGTWFEVSGKNVVDLGSGTGELCKLARDSGAQTVIGVNMSQGEIDFARQRVDAQFILQDIADYLEQCAPESIDQIYALNILEHLDKDTLLRVLESAYNTLREGGQLVAMVPNATSPFGGMTRYWDITHQNAFTPSSVLQLSRLVGFGEKVEFKERGPIPYGFISSIRYGLWQFIRHIIKSYLMIEHASTKGGIYTADMMFRMIK
ncbi:MAG: class I SAM-dependent methyltransferase [Methylococcaceae bacterium]